MDFIEENWDCFAGRFGQAWCQEVDDQLGEIVFANQTG